MILPRIVGQRLELCACNLKKTNFRNQGRISSVEDKAGRARAFPEVRKKQVLVTTVYRSMTPKKDPDTWCRDPGYIEGNGVFPFTTWIRK
jgi:hypothetical protein